MSRKRFSNKKIEKYRSSPIPGMIIGYAMRDVRERISDDLFDKERHDDSNENETKRYTKIKDKKKVLAKLKADGLHIQRYTNAIKSDIECAMTAIRSNYLAYNYISESLKSNRFVISLTEKEYYRQTEQDYDLTYADYYPEYMVIDQIAQEIRNAINSNYSENNSDVISRIYAELTDEEARLLEEEYGNLVLAFINPNIDPAVAEMIDSNIRSVRVHKPEFSSVQSE